jgi:hypothetical protein
MKKYFILALLLLVNISFAEQLIFEPPRNTTCRENIDHKIICYNGPTPFSNPIPYVNQKGVSGHIDSYGVRCYLMVAISNGRGSMYYTYYCPESGAQVRYASNVPTFIYVEEDPLRWGWSRPGIPWGDPSSICDSFNIKGTIDRCKVLINIP